MNKYRPDIDGLRAVAVLPVVLFHAGIPAVSGGFVGVDVFFVISGFLITGILAGDLEKGCFSLVRFYERRARRILPALVVVMLAGFAASWVITGPAGFVDYSTSASATALFSSNILFWQRTSSYFASEVELEPLLHTWSLAVEEQFYIVFPLLLWVLFRLSRRRMLAVFAGLCVLSFLLALIGVVFEPSAAFFLAPTRGWELGLGVLLALGCAPQTQNRLLHEAAAALGIAAILAAVVLYDASTPFPGMAALLPALGAAAVIWAGSQGPTNTGALLSMKPVVFVGLISYSLYLWHWPIFAFLRQVSGEVALPTMVAASAVAASFAIAALSWAYIEKPFRRPPPQGFGRATVFRWSGASLLSVIVVSGLVWVTDGVPTRLSPAVRQAYALTEQANREHRECMDLRPEDGLCSLGTGGATSEAVDFLLWGDSHALAIFPGVTLAAQKAGKSGLFAGKAGCPPLLGVIRADKPPGHDCAGFNAGVISALRARSDMPVVILTARWALAAEGSRPPGEADEPLLLARADGSSPGDRRPEDNFPVFRKGLADTVAAIRATGREVILLGDVPEIGWNVPRNLIRSIQWGEPLPAPPTRRSVEERSRRADQTFEELASQPGVRLVPLVPRLCSPLCRVIQDDKALYRDEDHLSDFGAVTIIPPAFAEAVWPQK